MLNWNDFIPYSQNFYERKTEVVAKELIGSYMVYFSPEGVLAGRVVETEAYIGPHDPACHSVSGKTRRNAAMFGPAGRVYVYFIYGMHYCFNVTTDSLDVPAAVLVRALEPLAGLEIMAHRRGTEDILNLCSGPGKLCQALAINNDFNGLSVITGPIRFYPSEIKEDEGSIEVTSRIGITKAADWPLRYCLKGSPFISVKR